VCFVLAGTVLALLLRPDPRQIARRLDALEPDPGGARPARPLAELARDGGVVRAVIAMVLSQGVMTLVMGITSLHMRDHGHALDPISIVFSAHTLGMFGFSLVTGWLVDRWGRLPMIRLGGVLLAASCALATLSHAAGPLTAALFVLGLGWNFAFVGGSALLSDRLSVAERGRTQGVNDLLMGSVAASAAVGGGVVYAAYGYAALAWGGAAISLLLLLAVRSGRRASPAAPA
jgi:MFS family permease